MYNTRVRKTVLSTLMAFRAAHPDRIVLLDTAIASADKCDFLYPEKLEKLLADLIPYCEVLMLRGDWEARKIFGKSYAPHESHTTRNNKIARDARTFFYQGSPIYMEKHLKSGVKDSEAKTIRVHFACCPVSRKIIIGHCGVHLPLR